VSALNLQDRTLVVGMVRADDPGPDFEPQLVTLDADSGRVIGMPPTICTNRTNCPETMRWYAP